MELVFMMLSCLFGYVAGIVTVCTNPLPRANPLQRQLENSRFDLDESARLLTKARQELDAAQTQARRFNAECDALELKLEESQARERALNRTLADLREMLAVVKPNG